MSTTRKEMTAGICRYCSCSETAACWGGCAWTDETQTLCTSCRRAEVLAEQLVRVLIVAAAKTSPAVAIDLVKGTEAWRALMSAAGVLEEITRELAGELLDGARDALIELDEIQGVLEGLGEQRDEESTLDAVRRLLPPRPRILIPGGG